MIKLAEVPLIEAVQMASETPARIMGISNKKGSLEIGKDADVVIFDENINIDTTIINGKIVYKRL
ncbi:MAG: amidohydrolase family protein, partial [Mucilaginibacter sp.]